MSVCYALYQLLRTLLKPRLSLVTENLALGNNWWSCEVTRVDLAAWSRSLVLGGLVESVARLALGSSHRQARDSY